MAALIFRQATRADLPVIVAMLADDMLGRSREMPSDRVDPRYLAGFGAIEANPNDMLAVAELDGVVVGCLQLTFLAGISNLGGWRGQIEGVRVSSGQRGGGIGRLMIEWAVTQGRAKGCKTMQLTTNATRADAQRFYTKLGFVPSHVGMKLTLE